MSVMLDTAAVLAIYFGEAGAGERFTSISGATPSQETLPAG